MSQYDFLAIPEVAAAGLISWRPLEGGLSNTTLFLETGEGPWVLRYNQAASGVDREREARVLAVASRLQLTPAVIACRPEAGYLLTEYLQAPTWQRPDFSNPDRLEKLIRRLRELHQVQVVGESALDIRSLINGYLQTTALGKQARLQAGVKGLVYELESDGYFEHRLSWCHHDLHGSNILGDTDLRLVDWEFAAPGNPLLDLGFLAQYQDMTPEETWNMMNIYYGGATRQDMARMTLVIRLAQALELLWLADRQERGELPEVAAQRYRQLAVVWT